MNKKAENILIGLFCLIAGIGAIASTYGLIYFGINTMKDIDYAWDEVPETQMSASSFAFHTTATLVAIAVLCLCIGIFYVAYNHDWELPQEESKHGNGPNGGEHITPEEVINNLRNTIGDDRLRELVLADKPEADDNHRHLKAI